MPYDCFISYASPDLSFAENLHSRLVALGFTVWFDRARLEPGCNWHMEIEQGCENSRIFLPVLTPRWKESDWTRFETYGAESVVPLIYEGRWEDLSTPPLERFQAESLDVSSCDDGKLERLGVILRRILDRPAPHKQDRLIHLHYRVNDHFVGRDHELTRIHEELHRNPKAVLTLGRVRAITAMGGVGKTTLARQYAEKFWRCYPEIFWVDARKGLENEFAEIHDLIFPERRELGLKSEDKARQALHRLNSSATCLLIIDNAENEDSTTEWIPKTGGCFTLITSRFAGWSEAVKTMHLYVLDKGASVKFLEMRTDRKADGAELKSCELLAEALGHLPLALEQAAAYIRKLSLCFGEYLDIYNSATMDLLAIRALGSTEYPDPVIASLQPSLRQVGPGARSILRIASMMAVTPVSWRIFLDLPELASNLADGSPARAAATPSASRVRVLNEIATLVDYSLAAFDGQKISLHPLVMTVQYETQSISEKRESWWQAATLMAGSSPKPVWKIDSREDWTIENDQEWKRLAPQIERLLEIRESIGDTPFLPAFELFAIDGLAAQESYARCIALCRPLCAAVNDGGEGASLRIEARESLAALLKQSLNLQEANTEFRELYALLAAERGEDDPRAMRALHNSACILELLDDSAAAEPLMREILSRRRRTLGERHYDTITSIHDLGWLLSRRQEVPCEAESLLIQSRQQWKATLGVGSPDFRTASENLARLYRAKRDFVRAIDIQQDLLDGTECVLGKDHLQCSEIRHNLALFQFNSGKFDVALENIQAVVEGYRRYLPPDHRDMLTAIQDLGTLLGSLGRSAESIALLQEALAGYERTQAVNSPDIMRTLNNLALELDSANRQDEADALWQRIMNFRENELGSDNPEMLRTWNNRSYSMRKRGLAGNCEPIDRRVVGATADAMGATHPLTLHRRNNLVLDLLLLCRAADALEQLNQNWRAGAERFANLTPRIPFLAYLAALLAGRAEQLFLGQVKTLLTGPELPTSPDIQVPWDFGYILEQLHDRLPNGAPELLAAIVAALNDRSKTAALNAFPEWHNQSPVSLDALWPEI